MDTLFLELINRSITAGYVILFVIVIRLLLRKAPRIFSYLLWTVVLFRLVIPFSFESMFSLVRINTRAVPENIMSAENPQIQSGIAAVEQTVNHSLPAPDVVGASMNPIQFWIGMGEVIWLAGVVLLLTYSVYTFVMLHRKLRYVSHITDNIYELSGSRMPFVFGILNPKIYLPDDISETERSYILKHEQTHIKRFDHIIKLFAFLVLCIHWFNPLVWIAFFLMSEDMELSCDESVLKQMGGDIKKDYSSSLLALSVGKPFIGGCPLAFGENNTKSRIKNILNYKKPAFWVVIAAVIIVAAACIGLASDPRDNSPQGENLTVEDYAERFVREEIAYYENAESADFKIVDSEITELKRLDRFDGMLGYPVEIWRIEYRWKPDDIEKAVLFLGNVNIDDEWILGDNDGWILKDGSMGFLALVFSYEEPEPRFLGSIFSNDGVNGNPDTVSGRETQLRVFLEEQGLLPHETYEGEHIVVKFPLSTGDTCQLLLSQPIGKGTSSIWCVERWMDGNGTVYYDTPETDGIALDYYRELQAQCDSGQNLWLLDPLEVSKNYINNVLGQYVTSTDLKPQYDADIKDFEETPVSSYIGFVSKFETGKPDRFSFHLDPVEWLTLEDGERLKQLNVNPDDLPNGFYIYNPNSYPQFFQGTDQTQFRIIDSEKGNNYKDVKAEEFKNYIEGFVDSESQLWSPLFRIITKDGFVQSMEEQYVP